jgi:hypothetical protein
MSVATEIGKLKELLDAGAITDKEFEEAKRGLLQNISSPQRLFPPRQYFFGKWKVAEGSDSFDVELLANGKIKMDITGAAPEVSLLLSRLMGFGSSGGQWWLDGANLRMTTRLGNAPTRYLMRLSDKGTEELDLEFSIAVTDSSEDELSGTSSNGRVQMWRLKQT